MQYEFFIGKRYLFSPRQDRSISIITWISVCGVALGVIALIVATSLMNGFRDNLRKAVTGSLPHIDIFSWQETIVNFEEIQNKVKQHPKVVGTAPYIFQGALLIGENKPKGGWLRGIDPVQETEVTNIASFLREEIYPLVPPTPDEQNEISTRMLERLSYPISRKQNLKAGIILGATLAYSLEVAIGDSIKLVSSEQRMTPIGDVPRVKQFEVIGIFESGISGYDEVLAFIDYRLMQKIYNMPGRVTGLGVKVSDPEEAPQVAKELEPITNLLVENWAEKNKAIFQVMKLEKLGLFLILTLIVVVAAFNIISSLIMLVIEKAREISILKSLGAKDNSIRRIFMFQGVIIGTIGTLSGVVLGIFLCWVLMTFDIIDIPPGVYPGGNRVPVLINWTDIGIIALSSFAICFLVTIYPATKAARLNPVDSLRYE